MTSEFNMRTACKCGHQIGRIETRNGQDCVLCDNCGKFQYCAPKTETGRAVRSVGSIHDVLKPKDKARILMRASGRCELCGSKEGVMHVGHLISVEAGFRAGMTDSEINSEENLCCLCDACNLGIGKEVIPVRLAVAMALARLRKPLEAKP